MKTIIFTRKSTPEKPEIGYGDVVTVIGPDGKEIYSGSASTCPNPYSVDGTKIVPWQKVYALVAPGQWEFECVLHNKFGKCILINSGMSVPTLNHNSNHSGQKYATEVFVHRGAINSKNQMWRGSRACFTVPPTDYEKFFSLFVEGEGGKIILIDGGAK